MRARLGLRGSRNNAFRVTTTVALFTLGAGLWQGLPTWPRSATARGDQTVAAAREMLDADRGIVAILDLPPGGAQRVVELANVGELTIYFQSTDAAQIEAVRQAADAAGLLGRRIVAQPGSPTSIHLAENVADGILVSPSARGQAIDAELLRVLRPRAAAFLGERRLVKPVPLGIDEWTHPYHGPDNNPQSSDQLARGAFRTQFLADPKFSPMPEQTVIAGGRMYKAMGHIAHKANQNAMLNTLLCINAYNGTILWQRPAGRAVGPLPLVVSRGSRRPADSRLRLPDLHLARFGWRRCA